MNKAGGKRENSGRKPIEDKKMPITVYIRQSTINKLGGKLGAKNFINSKIFKYEL